MSNGTGTTPAIDTTRLTRHFGPLVAVDAVTIAVPASTIFGLLGPNGAGKSTTIKMLTTLLVPTSGTAHVAGADIVRDAPRVRERIGYIPQMLSADGELSGFENLLISAKLHHVASAERQTRIDQALAFMGLTEASSALVRTYSGGMIRRLEIAQAMLHRPAVLFLDEPTVGLDPVARRVVRDHIREVRGEFGTTVVMTTHDMDEADEMCDTLAIMHHGRVSAIGSPASLKASVGPEATLDDVFIHFSGSTLDEGGGYRDVVRTRRTARRLG
ncbi:MAG TPA: ATP-binding cassette domain-containing protein [bacterium]|nr:ATP-binding cassette domain-containing protein [bacterium]